MLILTHPFLCAGCYSEHLLWINLLVSIQLSKASTALREAKCSGGLSLRLHSEQAAVEQGPNPAAGRKGLAALTQAGQVVRASSSWLDDSTPTLVTQEMTEKGQRKTGNDLASWASRGPTLTRGALETAVAGGSS